MRNLSTLKVVRVFFAEPLADVSMIVQEEKLLDDGKFMGVKEASKFSSLDLGSVASERRILDNSMVPILESSEFAEKDQNIEKILDSNYIGEIDSENLNDGFGVKIFDEYSEYHKYEGTWKAGQFDGKGELTFKNGEVYKGDFVAGTFEGRGTMLFDDGSKYIGGWKGGKKHGQGFYNYDDGSRLYG